MIAPLLVRIANVMFESGVYPRGLKMAKIVPVFKQGDGKDPNNYRPISLLNSVGKVFERLMYNRNVGFF